MASGNFKTGLAGIYDKLILLAGIIFLGISAYVFYGARTSASDEDAAFEQRIRALKPANPDAPDISEKIAGYERPVSLIAQPPLIHNDPDRIIGFFVPEARVFCINERCRYPIGLHWEKCPACGTEQIVKREEDPTADSDGDGMPDVWERKYGLNPHDPADADLDLDGDSFSNLQEYKDGTNPQDAKSHTELALLMHVADIKSTMLPLMFKGASRMPNGKFNCSFNYLHPQRREIMTLYVKEGEQIANPSLKVDSGYKLDSMEVKEEEYHDPVTNSRRTREVRTAIISNAAGKTYRLETDKRVNDDDFIITIAQDFKGGQDVVLKGDEEFEVDGRKYRVVKVDKDLMKVVIRGEADKRDITLSREGAAR